MKSKTNSEGAWHSEEGQQVKGKDRIVKRKGMRQKGRVGDKDRAQDGRVEQAFKKGQEVKGKGGIVKRQGMRQEGRVSDIVIEHSFEG